MTVSVVDTATASPGAGVTTFAASLVGATAPNAILWVLAGDKNSGTITPPADCPNLPFNLKGTGSPADQVTLALAYGTADGGETSISGTVGANIAGGQLWVAELADNVGTGPWARWGSVTNETNGSDVTSVALTGLSATETGLAVAVVAADSVNTQGTVTWTSSTGHTFTARRATNSGGGQAGLWIATAPVTKGDTVSVTFSRSGGTADQHTGVMTVFARTVVNQGALAGQLPTMTGALAGTVKTAAELAAQLPALSGALTAAMTTAGALAAQLPTLTGDLTGTVEQAAGTGELSARLPTMTGALTAAMTTTGQLDAVLPGMVGDLIAPFQWEKPARAGASAQVRTGPRAAGGALATGPRASSGVVEA